MILSVQTTMATPEEARRLAEAMVAGRFAACAQIEPIESVYRWEGRVMVEREARITFKTSTARAPALQAEIRRLHPYTLPMIVVFACHDVLPDYAAWVEAETAPAA